MKSLHERIEATRKTVGLPVIAGTTEELFHDVYLNQLAIMEALVGRTRADEELFEQLNRRLIEATQGEPCD